MARDKTTGETPPPDERLNNVSAPGWPKPIPVRKNQLTMSYWFVVIIPLAIMLFALFMERVELRLRSLTIREHEVEEFLEQARPDEVRALYGHGIGRALELFRLRRLEVRPQRGRPKRERART